MDEGSNKEIDKLGRQPDVSLPDSLPVPPPSLFLYLGLLLFAVILLVASFKVYSEKWSGVLVNLSTEIFGAVLILILVERRFKQSEIRFVQDIPQTTMNIFIGWFSKDIKVTKGYVSVLLTQLEKTSLPGYYSRPEIEAKLLAKINEGIILIGDYGMGKTTLLQWLAQKQAEEVLKNPRKARIPIVIPLRKCSDSEVSRFVLKAVQSFYPISDRTFRRQLERGRYICFLDGLDEVVTPLILLDKVKHFRETYPQNVLFLSSRPHVKNLAINLKLEEYVIPPLKREEVLRLLSLRNPDNE